MDIHFLGYGSVIQIPELQKQESAHAPKSEGYATNRVIPKEFKTGTIELDRVTLRHGGEWMRVQLERPMTLTKLNLRYQNNKYGDGVLCSAPHLNRT